MCKLKIKKESKLKKLILFLLNISMLSACATTNKGKIIETVTVSALAGAAYGQNQPEFKNENAMLYGSLAGLTASLIGLYVFDEEKRSDELKDKVTKLEAELESFGKSPMLELNQQNNNSDLKGGTRVQVQSFLPKKLQKLVKPGEWSLNRIDEWEQLDDTKMIHKDQLLEFKPPELLVPATK